MLTKFALLVYLVLGAHAKNPLDEGSFESPGPRTRPRFRYWLPDASVDADVVVGDIKSAGRIGAGGVEFIPFYNYGGKQGAAPEGADWSKYGFGTPAFHEMFKKALRAHAENGLYMDFPLGPNQGQGVPASLDDEGLQWDLSSFAQTIPANGSFRGTIPGWGSGELVALTSALALSTVQRHELTRDFSRQTNLTWVEYQLAHKSLRDITDEVSLSTGEAELSFPKREGDERHVLFAFYQYQPHHRNLQFERRNSDSVFDFGSFVVDHHSRRGAETLTKFWEDHLLDKETEDLIRKAGNYVWEDSIEIMSNMSWTPSLPAVFKELHGYSIKPILPLLTFKQNTEYTFRYTFGTFNCLLDSPYRGAGYVNDYRRALETGYNNYILALRDWTHERLHLQYSSQPTYGMPQDMAAAIPHVDIPEYESLAFGDNIDVYRRFIGTAHLAGKNIISNELGAIVFTAYSYTMKTLLGQFHRAVIGGTNQLIIHGQTFSGEWYGTTWPGYTPFRYLFSDIFSPKQPAWDYGLADVMNYFARTQFVQRQGVPRTDVAVVHKMSRTSLSLPAAYTDTDLEEDGWSYSYLSPVSFDLREAHVQNGVFGPEGPAWQALVVQSSDNLTLADVEHLQAFADQGLPVVLSGGRPGYWPSRSSCSKASFERAVKRLSVSDNVYLVDRGQVSSKLLALGLHPRVRVDAPGVVHATWREDNVAGINYSFMLNDQNNTISGTAVFASGGTPYMLDAWSGKKQPILGFTKEDGRVAIPITLAAGQAMIVAFHGVADEKVEAPSCHFIELPRHVLGVSQAGSGLNMQVPASNSTNTGTLSSGRTVHVDSDFVGETLNLSNWTLTVEKWEKPADIWQSAEIASKVNITLELEKLTSWLNIDELKSVSGLGYYRTTFEWSKTTSLGAYLSVSGITHTIRVAINGKPVDPADHRNFFKDIGEHLVDGENEVLILVSTTMWNYLRTIGREVRESGAWPPGLQNAELAPSFFPSLDMGLTGEVKVVPYREVFISC